MPLPNIQNIRTVIFDCDGVMLDSANANREYYNRILAHLGQPALSAEQFAYVHMSTLDQALIHLFPREQDLAVARNYRRTMNYRDFIGFMELEPDLKPLLNRLRPRYATAIATNRSDSMQWVLQTFGLQAHFDLVLTAADVAHPKPDPEMLTRILEHFHLTPLQAVYVGDSRVDETAARLVGIPLVAYRHPTLQAEWHIQRLAQLGDLLL